MKEHIFHVVLSVVTGGFWIIIYLIRVFIAIQDNKNISATFQTVPKQALVYQKRTFASQAEADDDYHSDYADAYSYDIRGESFYRDNLMAVITSKNAFQQGELIVDAILVLEPDNKFDETAVAVFIEGKQVGHIPKEESFEVTEYIEDLNVKALQVKALIGWNTKSSNPPIGVRLDFNF
jgi:hypothetical protein